LTYRSTNISNKFPKKLNLVVNKLYSGIVNHTIECQFDFRYIR